VVTHRRTRNSVLFLCKVGLFMRHGFVSSVSRVANMSTRTPSHTRSLSSGEKTRDAREVSRAAEVCRGCKKEFLSIRQSRQICQLCKRTVISCGFVWFCVVLTKKLIGRRQPGSEQNKPMLCSTRNWRRPNRRKKRRWTRAVRPCRQLRPSRQLPNKKIADVCMFFV